ncbi:hypothetical protein CEXT_12071 [Caerostris extrusa]|uniref:RING-type domain-containing protein n=1 Tax=Caerostris extrusa TaxID=172846 RepID=A0AAV4Y597_CAEEX|nr:hypothetical protein CEXT_12071 [Caerostris extrusa]
MASSVVSRCLQAPCFTDGCNTKKNVGTTWHVPLTSSAAVKMTTDIFSNSINLSNDVKPVSNMAIKKNIPEKLNLKRIEQIERTIQGKDEDVVDNPPSHHLERFLSDDHSLEKQIFDVMKYEVNRYNSFMGRWPLSYVKTKDLAENGFFYLLSEDRVQCAFCGIIIDDWNVGDIPLKEHMKKAPKCPFLMTSNVGNIPMQKQKPVKKSLSKLIPNSKSNSTSLSGQAKYPRMMELKNRFATYKDWPLIMLSSRQLSECGLFYTGNGDIVTCFYCGGSLGNWELNDDPWVEHEKFFPDCGYLDLVKCRRNPEQHSTHHISPATVKTSTPLAQSLAVRSDSVPSEIIRQACDIFPSSLVQKVVTHHLNTTGRHFMSLHDLCEATLEYKDRELAKSMSSRKDREVLSSENFTKNSAADENVKGLKDICKICMSEEMNIVFEPCRHLVSCQNCAQVLFNCPLCRKPITNRMKVFRG